MLLVRRLGGSLEEQVAALVHDAGHGAFSHVIDRVHDDASDAWHEEHGVAWVMGTELPGLLERHGFDPEHLLVPHRWPLLDRPSPDLCADRVDYTLRDCLHEGLVDVEGARAFLDALVVTPDRDVAVDDPGHAVWFAELFAELVRTVFMDPVGVWSDAVLAGVIRRALEGGAIDDDALMGTDGELLERLRATGDPDLDLLRPGARVEHDPHEPDAVANPKPRVVDPLVVGGPDGPIRASQLAPRLLAVADDIRARSAAGVRVRAIPRPPGRGTTGTG
jgi:HD superfamily phosphohydrolase